MLRTYLLSEVLQRVAQSISNSLSSVREPAEDHIGGAFEYLIFDIGNVVVEQCL